MKPVYATIPLTPGTHQGGITSIQVAPKEWLTADPVIDFATGKILTAVTLVPNIWITLNFTQNSYDFTETPKSNRMGSYFEIIAKGIVNYNDGFIQQVLQSLRFNELVCLVKDRDKNIKLAGNTARGMILQFNPTNVNDSGGSKTIPVTLTYQSEDPAPFYNV